VSNHWTLTGVARLLLEPPSSRGHYSTMFRKAEELCNSDLLCYVNADIILMSDFVTALASDVTPIPAMASMPNHCSWEGLGA
jgi:hypothetical protein